MKNQPRVQIVFALFLTISVYLFFALVPASSIIVAQSEAQSSSQTVNTLFDYALISAGKLKTIWERNRAFAYIAAKFAEAKEFEKALKTADKIQDETQRAQTLAEIAVFLRQNGDEEEADLMLSRARTFKRPTEKGFGMVSYAEKEVYSTIAVAYSKNGQYEVALKVAEEIKDDYKRTDTIRIILEKYVWDDAALISEQNLTRIIEIVNEGLNNDAQRRAISCLLALSYAKANDFESAEELANEVGDEFDGQSVWHHYSKEFALSTLAQMLTEDGKDAEAFRLVNSYTGYTQEKALLAIANVFVKQGKYELAEKTLNQLLGKEKNNFTSVVWASAAVIYKKLKRDQQCDALLRLAYTNAVSAKDKTRKDYDLVFVAERAAEVGNYSLAIESLQTKRKYVVYDYVQAFGNVGAVAAKEKQFVTLDKIISEISQVQVVPANSGKILAFTKIAEALIENKEKERTSLVLDKAIVIWQNNADSSVEDLRGFAIALAKNKQFDSSLNVAMKIQAGEGYQIVCALADLGLEFARHSWTLDVKQRKSLDRFVAISK